jgi:hypothetical protein
MSRLEHSADAFVMHQWSGGALKGSQYGYVLEWVGDLPSWMAVKVLRQGTWGKVHVGIRFILRQSLAWPTCRRFPAISSSTHYIQHRSSPPPSNLQPSTVATAPCLSFQQRTAMSWKLTKSAIFLPAKFLR